MALIKCPECHKKVSSETEKCVHCGATITREYAENAEVAPAHGFVKPKWFTKKFLIIVSAIAGTVVIICCSVFISRYITMRRYKDILIQALIDQQIYPYSTSQFERYIDIEGVYGSFFYNSNNDLELADYCILFSVSNPKEENLLAWISYSSNPDKYHIRYIKDADEQTKLSAESSGQKIY